MQALNLPKFPLTEWECMHKLFERRWHRRCRVIQEVALASLVIVFCGSRILDWDELGRAAQ